MIGLQQTVAAAAASHVAAGQGLAFLVNVDGAPTEWAMVPERYRGGLDRWIMHGTLPGSFLQAVLRNDLYNAVFRADDADGPAGAQIRPILTFLIMNVPLVCFGSSARVEDWEKRGGLAGEAADG